MKSSYSTTSLATLTSLPPIGCWFHSFEQLLDRLRPHFARPQPFQHARQYLQAILSDIPRKNGWQIAEQAQQSRPYGIQRLLSQAVWNEDAVRDEVRNLVCRSLQPPAQHPLFPVLVLDESGCPKRGKHSAGVAPQYCGLTGRVENCQVGVFLCCVTALGHGLIDRELYLPDSWCADAARRHAAHIPDHLRFQTKPELGITMLQRVLAAGLTVRWVVADTVYGHSSDLRLWLEQQALSYALAVPSHEVLAVQTETGPRLATVAHLVAEVVAPTDWQRLMASDGTKGPRLFDWVQLPLVASASTTGSRCHWLVVRRCLEEPHELAYYLVWAPVEAPLSLLVQAIGTRWHIEEDLKHSKGLGLDHGEVRSYLGWYRHLTLVLLAAAFLLSLTVHQAALTQPPESEPQEAVTSTPALIALTRQEVRHVLARLLWPPPCSLPHVWQWSGWRRQHQAQARAAHCRQRSRASPSPTLTASSLEA